MKYLLIFIESPKTNFKLFSKKSIKSFLLSFTRATDFSFISPYIINSFQQNSCIKQYNFDNLNLSNKKKVSIMTL